MGEVYRARDSRLDRFVAVKVITGHLSGDPKAMARFEREATASAAPSHPNILSIFDFGEQDGVAYAVMELLEGETLRERSTRGPLPTAKAQDVALQIARGLAAAREKGIVHRDLKPGNIFLTGSGHVKILDFGLAKLLPRESQAEGYTQDAPTKDAPTHSGAVMGTVGYMAPEHARRLPADARTDIFAFGVVLYEMLSGKHPFDRGSAADTLAAILKEDPPPLPPASPPALDRIVRECLEKRPEDRFSSAHDIGLALQAISGNDLEGGPALGRSGTASRSRRGWLAAFCVAGLILVAAAVGFFAWRRQDIRRVAGTGVRDGAPCLVALPCKVLGSPESAYLTDAVLFTDGISEALDPDGEEYGVWRLERVVWERRHLAAREVTRAIEASLDAFVRGTPYSDDRTLVIPRRLPADSDPGAD